MHEKPNRYQFVAAIHEATSNCFKRAEIRIRLIRVLGKDSHEIQARIDKDYSTAEKLIAMSTNILNGTIDNKTSLN